MSNIGNLQKKIIGFTKLGERNQEKFPIFKIVNEVTIFLVLSSIFTVR